MATTEEAQAAILEAIKVAADLLVQTMNAQAQAHADEVNKLAEAWAWVSAEDLE